MYQLSDAMHLNAAIRWKKSTVRRPHPLQSHIKPAIAYKIGEKDGYEYLDKGSFAYYYVNDYERIKQLDYSRLKPTTLYIPCKVISYLKYRFTEGWGKRIYIKSDELPNAEVGLFFRDIEIRNFDLYEFYGIGGMIVIGVCGLLLWGLLESIFPRANEKVLGSILGVIGFIVFCVLPLLLFLF